jgi:1-deoxy-D-xylulose-5-phosphate reductoisomerase
MTPAAKNVAVLGSTGSIGRSALEVIAHMPERFRTVVLSANRSLDLLAAQAAEHRPQLVVAADGDASDAHDWSTLPSGVRIESGSEALQRAASRDDVDIVLAGIVGSAGLRSTWAAIEAGKTVALANKETLVVAGQLVTSRAAATGARILPVDSEHSAVFQAMQSGKPAEVRRIVLTASGGPFRSYSAEQMASVTVEEALAHPTWDMGPKITVDSATMMNKALEVIEARWLFGLEANQISVVVHPQSIVHSMVEFVDGSVVAQLSPPDMRLPIQYALTYPQRLPSITPRVDWTQAMALSFEPPDFDRFPAIELGYQAARAGGTAGAVLNAANEAAVQGFLEGDLALVEIVPACRSVLEHHTFDASPSLDDLFEIDAWARREVLRWVCT